MKIVRNFVITVLVICTCFWLLGKLNVIPSLRDVFKPKAVAIDETPILIKEIKSIGQLITYSSVDEVVVDSVITTRVSSAIDALNRVTPFAILPSGTKRLVLICRGKVFAGTDLSQLNDTSISVSQDTVRLHLPKATILDAIINPADVETFAEEGTWSPDEVAAVKLKAKRLIQERAIKQDIVKKASEKSTAMMESYLRNLGYAQVYVSER